MNAPLIANLIALVCTGFATGLLARTLSRGGYGRAKRALFGASAIYALVAISNVLEHGGITDVLDPVEDVLEIIFLLGFFFFVHAWQAERALEGIRTQSAWLSATFSAIGAGVLTTDETGIVRTANPEMARLIGRAELELLGRPIDEVLVLVASDGLSTPLPNPVARALETGRVVEVPVGAQLSVSGTAWVPASGIVSPMLDTRETVRGAVAVLRDESESVQLKEQLLHTRKMDALGQLAGGVAHDFNNMLGGILGAADMLAEDVESEDTTGKRARLVEIIVAAAENAANLTAKLLTFGRKARLEVTHLDVRVLIESTIAIAARSMDKRVHIALEMSDDALVIAGDQTQLKSALLNLLLNARDALDGEGSISVTARRELLDREWCETSAFAIAEGPYVMISVRDTGSGMSPAVQQRIFEPFFTTKPEGKGTGLGLAAVFGAIESHRGAIEVYSELGRGTVFHVYLPLSGVAASIDTAPAHEERAPRRGGVLIVDDEAVIRATVELMLAKTGFTLYSAESGARALELFRESPDAIDVVLLDVVMPDASGFEIADALRSMKPDVRIVFASGFVRDVSKSPGGAPFIDKPFRKAKLLDALHAALDEHPASDSTTHERSLV